MAEPKGGPVKPPTLDLKPSRTNAPKSGPKTARSGRTGAAQKPDTQKTAASGPGRETASSAATTGTTTAKSSATKDHRQNGPQGTQKPASNPASPASSNFERNEKTGSGGGGGGFSYMLAGLSAVGGALLALLLLVPLILSGVVQPGGQRTLQADTSRLSQQVGLNQEQISETLVGFRAMNDQMDQFRLQISQQLDQLKGELDKTGGRQDALEARLDEISSQQSRVQEQTAALDEQVQSALSRLSAPPSAPPFDPTPLNEEISALNARLDAIAAGASSDDAEKLAVDIADIRSQIQSGTQALSQRIDLPLARLEDRLSEITTRIEALGQRIDTVGAGTAASAQLVADLEQSLSEISAGQRLLQEELAALKQSQPDPADQQAAQADQTGKDSDTPPMQPAFALISLELALNNARPFENELASLEAARPDLVVSQDLRQAAATGLTPPQAIIADFNRALPAMLAARPTDPDANWSERTVSALKSLLAIRPTDATSADPLDNLVARLEQAVTRQDFSGAAPLLDLLPPPMRQALGPSVRDIKLMGEVMQLLQKARSGPGPASPNEAAPAQITSDPAQTGETR